MPQRVVFLFKVSHFSLVTHAQLCLSFYTVQVVVTRNSDGVKSEH